MYIFIVNPNARTGRGLQLWKNIESILEKKNVSYQVYFTRYQGHASKITREITSGSEPCTIIALGGDGTVNEIINGISCLSKTTLGYIPIGSGNDFARGVHLPSKPEEALKNILSPSHYTDLDIGVITYGDGKKRRFAVSSGFGYDAGICHEVMVTPLKVWLNKIKLGKLTYALVGIQNLLTMTPKKMTIILDDKQKLELPNAYFATAMNLPYEGGGFKFCPKAKGEDGFLDMIAAAGLSKPKVLSLFPFALVGRHTHFQGIHMYRCKKAEFISEIPLPVHADGEPVLKQTRICACLEPEKLHMIGAPV